MRRKQITKADAMDLRPGDELHAGRCTLRVGKRGGLHVSIERWRVSGQTKTWKTRPEQFSVPIKFGLRTCATLSNVNAERFHQAAECAVLQRLEASVAPPDFTDCPWER